MVEQGEPAPTKTVTLVTQATIPKYISQEPTETIQQARYFLKPGAAAAEAEVLVMVALVGAAEELGVLVLMGQQTQEQQQSLAVRPLSKVPLKETV